MLRCRACRHWIHPPAPICPACLARDVAPEAVSGRARVATFTVNHQPWIPGFDPPYLVAIVELDEQRGPAPHHESRELRDRRRAHRHAGARRSSRSATTSGFRSSSPTRSARERRRRAPRRDQRDRAVAGRAAPRSRRDGPHARRVPRGDRRRRPRSRATSTALATYPGGWFGPRGFSGPGIPELQDALRLNLNWYAGGPEQPGQLGSVIEAITAVACGLANHVLCFRTVWESTAQGGGGRAGIGTPAAEAAARAFAPAASWSGRCPTAPRRPRCGSRCSRSATCTSTAPRASSWRRSR